MPITTANTNIRKEQAGDSQRISEVTKAAFLNAAHTSHAEQFVVESLRRAKALSISLVAEYDDEIIGHVAVSPVTISDGSEHWYGLGPISVLPAEQGKGLGARLMEEAINELTRIKAKGCVLLGDPNYYQRFGFKPKAGLVLVDVPPEYFQALLLEGEWPQGVVTYHEAFSATG